VAAATYGRGSLAPLALTVTAVPSFALVTELADPPEYYRPYSASLNGIYGDVETGVGGWLTFLTMLGLAAGSTIWLGRGLQILADRRWATGLLVVIVLAAIVGIAVANGYTDDAECNLGRVDESDVSSDWLLWLVLYLPATMVGMGIGAMTRRWFASGWLLLAGAAAACLGLGVIAFQVISLCAD
jgi:hypothetical protein